MWHHAHLMDAMAGTHLVPPSFALPPPGERARVCARSSRLAGRVRAEVRPARRRATMTTEQVPLALDLRPGAGHRRSLAGRQHDRGNWPASPEITPAHVQADEKEHGELQAGDIVLFRTGHLDKHFKPQPHDAGRLVRSAGGQERRLAGARARRDRLSEEQGIRCVATDAPDLGASIPSGR